MLSSGRRHTSGTGVWSSGVCAFYLVVSSVAVLSEVSGSNTPEVVLAVLEMLVVREESTFTTRVRSEERRVGKECRFQRTTPAVRVPPPVAEQRRVPAGIPSDRLTPVASDGPLFVTVSV